MTQKQKGILRAIKECEEARMSRENETGDYALGFRIGLGMALRHLEDIRDMEA